MDPRSSSVHLSNATRTTSIYCTSRTQTLAVMCKSSNYHFLQKSGTYPTHPEPSSITEYELAPENSWLVEDETYQKGKEHMLDSATTLLVRLLITGKELASTYYSEVGLELADRSACLRVSRDTCVWTSQKRAGEAKHSLLSNLPTLSGGQLGLWREWFQGKCRINKRLCIFRVWLKKLALWAHYLRSLDEYVR